MSGLMVLVGCLLVVAVIAAPNIARATSNKASGPVALSRSLTRESVEPTAVEYAFIKGEITVKGEDWIKGEHSLKLSPALCEHLQVYATPLASFERKAGGEQMRKAGGEQDILGAIAPGTCMYSLRVPDKGNYKVGVREVHLKAFNDKTLDDKHKGDADFIKLSQQYKEHKGEHAWYLKYGGGFDKWVKSENDGLDIKGEHKDIKLDGKTSIQMPLYITLTGNG